MIKILNLQWENTLFFLKVIQIIKIPTNKPTKDINYLCKYFKALLDPLKKDIFHKKSEEENELQLNDILLFWYERRIFCWQAS